MTNNNNNNQDDLKVDVNLRTTNEGEELIGGVNFDTGYVESHIDNFVESNEVVKFISSDTKHVLEKISVRDSTFGSVYHDNTLANFMRRPVKIANYTWTIGSDANFVFNPWQLFITDSAVAKKIDNYQYMRFNINVQFQINATQFHYGKLLVSYNPFPAIMRNSAGGEFGTPQAALLEKSQRPHIFIDACTSQPVEMKQPYFNVKDWFSITPYSADEFNIGEINIDSFSPLATASADATADVKIVVYAYATEVELDIPTSVSNIVPQAPKDEYQENDRIISKTASAVSNAAGALRNVPVIGEMAKAVEVGAGIAASVARFFGFSKPNNIEPPQYVKRVILSNMANTVGSDMTSTLAFDNKQGVSMDYSTVGLEQKTDQMTISHIAGTETFIQNVPWTQGDSLDSEIFWINVGPNYALNNFAYGATSERRLHMSSLAYAALPFQYWSGTIIYRIQVIASQYHKGRIRISYEPKGALNAGTSYNTAYSTILDLDQANDLEFTVSWAQDVSYKRVQDPRIYNFALPAGGIKNYNDEFQNGTIFITVVNELTAPSLTADVSINIFARAGEDFELFAPRETGNGLTFERLSLRRSDPLPGFAGELPEEDVGIKRQLAIKKEKAPSKLDMILNKAYAKISLSKADSIFLMNNHDVYSDPKLSHFLDEYDNMFYKDRIAQAPNDDGNFFDYQMQNTTQSTSRRLQLVGQPQVSAMEKRSLIFHGDPVKSFRAVIKRFMFHELLYSGTNDNNDEDLLVTEINRHIIPVAYGGSLAAYYPALSAAAFNQTNTVLLAYLFNAYVGWKGAIRYKFVPLNSSGQPGWINVNRTFSKPDIPDAADWILSVTPTSDIAALSAYFVTKVNNWDGGVASHQLGQQGTEVEYPWYNQYRFCNSKMNDFPIGLSGDNSDTMYQKILYSTMTNPSATTSINALASYVSVGEDFNFFWYIGAPNFIYDESIPAQV